jgi:uncharacterized protein YkwD
VSRPTTVLSATVSVLACLALGASSAVASEAFQVQVSARAASRSGEKHHGPSHGKHATSRTKHHAASRRTISAVKPRAPRRVAAPRTSANEASQTRAVTIAKVLATPCQNAQLLPEPGNLPVIREAVLCLINTERAQNGEEPLVPNVELERAAESHGQEMIALNYFEHVSPSGLTPVGRIKTTGYIPSGEVGYVIGENLAWGTLSLATPQAIVNAWIASPGHLANILETKYRETGINVMPEVPSSLSEGSPGATYTQEFGVIIR